MLCDDRVTCGRVALRTIELLLVSLDKTADEFDKYRAKMPWPALAFGGKRGAELAERFHVSGIPALVLLRQDGTLISSMPSEGSNPRLKSA